MIITDKDLQKMERIERLTLVNSITGIKPANLIGTQSTSGMTNLAVFSSVVHLGSAPPLIGMISRPDADAKRDTLANLMATGYYSINHLPITHAEQGHYTSARFTSDVSEFDACKFTAAYLPDVPAPYVKESPVVMMMAFQELVPIKANGTILIIGQLEQLIIADAAILSDGQIDLEKAQSAGIGGLNQYYSLTKKASFPYAKVDKLPSF